METQKKALITGITGQDGAYLAALLIQKGYRVYGTYRRVSSSNFWRLEHLGIKDKIGLVCMELTDQVSVQRVMAELRPDEVYNLAAQSFVAASFAQPIYTGELDGLSVARLLEVVQTMLPGTRFYQASTSEMFGKVQTVPQTETTPFYPRSPYGIAKLYGHWTAVHYREAYGIYAVSGIAFNHESPLRGTEFASRKITSGLVAVEAGRQECLTLGNLDAVRDWGHAADFVRGMWLMMQQEKPDDYVLATGRSISIRTFVEMAAAAMGVTLVWEGQGLDEVARDPATGKVWVRIDPQYYRPAEVDILQGDASKIQAALGWKPAISLEDMIAEMVAFDRARLVGDAPSR